MRGGAIIGLMGLTALVAYSIGRYDAPIIRPSASIEKSVQLAAAPLELPWPAKPEAPPPTPTPSVPQTKTTPAAPAQSEIKRKGELALTAAAIAAILVQASRDQYHATGRPCACPDDLTRNGQHCGGRSAYSRPGGASPLCYPSDVTAEMIQSYQERARSQR
jgi:hypothetical protein